MRNSKPILGYWRLGFRGSKAVIVETYEYILSAKKDFYSEDYPEFVRDFVETKEFFVIQGNDNELVPCRLEDCGDSDQLILRGHAITLCDVGQLEDLFFDFVDDTPPAELLEAAYCTWLPGDNSTWLTYFEPGSSDRIHFGIDLYLTEGEENAPCSSNYGEYFGDDGYHPFEDYFLDMLGLKSVDKCFDEPIPGQILTKKGLRYNRDKTTATLSQKITKTGLYHFNNTLTRIIVPENLTEIDYRAFIGCTGLTEWDIQSPNAKFYSEQGALIEKEHKILVCWPSASGAVVIPDGVTEIGKGAFFGCTALTSVVIPESVTTIGFSAFEGCTGLTDVSIPKSVKQIKGLAFADCTSLTSVSLAEGVAKIDDLAFFGCTALTGITFPKSLTEIGVYAFSHCESLTSVTIPKSIKKLWWGVFANCTGLTSAEILMSSAKLPDNLFDGCEKLAAVTIPARLLSIGECVFWDCDSLTSIQAPKTPVSKFKDSRCQPAAALGFAILEQQQVEMSKTVRTGYLNYIQKNREKLYDLALEHPVLMSLMAKEKLIPEDEFDGLLQKSTEQENVEVNAILLEYKHRNFEAADPLEHLTLDKT